jgi:two-component system chemotaxis response regulator CheB
MSKPVRVLVVDDSALMRKLLTQILEADTSIEVVGTAMDGSFALKKIGELKPDVVSLDLDMPRMDGLETLREIVRNYNVPVIVVSAHTERGAYSALNALAQGAFDFVTKPSDAASGHMPEIADELRAKIKVAAQAGPPKLVTPVLQPARKLQKLERGSLQAPPTCIVAIGISTGGPNALQFIFSQMPREFPGSILVVQHMPEGFTEMFARRLDDHSPMQVKHAQSGDLLLAGRVLVCPGNKHMKIRRAPLGNVVVLSDDPKVNGHRPSVDVLFHSLAQEIGSGSLAVLMTGMGVDGAHGLGAVKAAGGLTLVQSPETCVVDAMPRAAIEKGYAGRIVPLEAMASTLLTHCAPLTISNSEPVTLHR